MAKQTSASRGVQRTQPAHCKSCEAASASPWSCGRYSADCFSCQARQFAHSPQCMEAYLGHPQAIIAAMRVIWDTPDLYRRGRVEVYKWRKMIDEDRDETV